MFNDIKIIGQGNKSQTRKTTIITLLYYLRGPHPVPYRKTKQPTKRRYLFQFIQRVSVITVVGTLIVERSESHLICALQSNPLCKHFNKRYISKLLCTTRFQNTRYSQNRKVTKPNNFKGSGSHGPKQERQNRQNHLCLREGNLCYNNYYIIQEL